MKALFLLLTVVMLTVSACKKNISEKNTAISDTAVDGPVTCTGDTWEQVQNFVGWHYKTCLVYNNKAYFFHHGQEDNPYHNTITIYDGSSWQTIQSNIPATVLTTYVLVKFVIGNKAYFSSPDCHNIFAYDFASNTWTPKSPFPGPTRSFVSSFAIGNKGYLTAGRSGYTHYNDLWEYDPVADNWTQKTSFPNFGKTNAAAFSIGNKGYLLNGVITNLMLDPPYFFYLNDLMQYDPVTDSWDVKTSYPGEPNAYPECFVSGGYGYAGYGSNKNTDFKDFYRYSPSTDSWSATSQCPLDVAVAGFSINSKGYLVGRTDRSSTIKMYKYNPKVCAPLGSGGGL